jgi:hypothetical protein
VGQDIEITFFMDYFLDDGVTLVPLQLVCVDASGNEVLRLDDFAAESASLETSSDTSCEAAFSAGGLECAQPSATNLANPPGFFALGTSLMMGEVVVDPAIVPLVMPRYSVADPSTPLTNRQSGQCSSTVAPHGQFSAFSVGASSTSVYVQYDMSASNDYVAEQRAEVQAGTHNFWPSPVVDVKYLLQTESIAWMGEDLPIPTQTNPASISGKSLSVYEEKTHPVVLDFYGPGELGTGLGICAHPDNEKNGCVVQCNSVVDGGCVGMVSPKTFNTEDGCAWLPSPLGLDGSPVPAGETWRWLNTPPLAAVGPEPAIVHVRVENACGRVIIFKVMVGTDAHAAPHDVDDETELACD